MIFFCNYAAMLARYVDWIFYSLCFCVIPIDISKVASDARFLGYRGCAEWLVDAGMVLNFPHRTSVMRTVLIRSRISVYFF